MWGSFHRPASPNSAGTSAAWIRMSSASAALKRGEIPIYEPGFDALVDHNTRAGTLRFSTLLSDAVPKADVVFLAVGTPMRRGDGYADLSYIYEAVAEIAPHLESGAIVATKSTVPVGTSREIKRRLWELRRDAGFVVCSNPEFLREGSAIHDFTHPDRVLIGCDEEHGRAMMRRIYEPLALRDAPIVFVTLGIGGTCKICCQCLLGHENYVHQ